MNLKKIPTKIKLIFIIAVIFVIITSALVINKEKMSSKSSDVKFTAIPVNVVNIKKQVKSENISAIGTVQADNDVTVISETQGKVLQVYVKTGDRVIKGTLIASIDNELKLAAYLSAKGILEKARKDMERMTNLYKENYISDSDMENIKLNATNAEAQFIVAQRQLNDTKIKAPISGLISDKFINVGSTIAPGTQVVNIIDIENLKIKLNIQENDIFKLKSGDIVNITSDIYPETLFNGKIESAGSKGDSTHNFPVEISLSNSIKNPLKAGMTVKVVFNSIDNKSIDTIPRMAVIGSIKKPQVFVIEGNIAKLKNIVVGNEYGNDIELLTGLNPDDRIVVNGQNNLSDNVEVTVLDQ